MATARDIFNFWLPHNHAMAGKEYTIPGVEVTDTSTGETHTIGGGTYTYTIDPETPKNTGVNTMTTGSDVNNAINDYNEEMRRYNDQQLAWAKEQFATQQQNFQTELQLKQQERADTILENETTRQREDTYYQRMIKDLAQAGINPLMAGQLSGAGVKMGTVANGNINLPGAVGLGTAAPQSQAGAVATENASIRQAETAKEEHMLKAKEIELQEEQLKKSEEQFYKGLDQAWEIAKKDRELRKELSNAESEVEKWITNANNQTKKEIAEEQNKITQNFQKIEEELKKRGQNFEIIEGILRDIISIGGTLLMFKAMGGGKGKIEGNKAIQGDKWGEPLKPKLNEFNKGNPATPGWSSGGIYFGN